MTTLDIEIAVAEYFNIRKNIIIPNISWGFGIHECDILICTNAGYLYEVEIKISLPDLIKDKEKWHQHRHKKIKKLYFAIPQSLLMFSQYIPEHAGILVIKQIRLKDITYYKCSKVKDAKNNNTLLLTLKEKFKLTRLGTMRIFGLKKKIRVLKQDKSNNIVPVITHIR